MSDTQTPSQPDSAPAARPALKVPLARARAAGEAVDTQWPAILLAPVSRSADGTPAPLLGDGVAVLASHALAAVGRGEAPAATAIDAQRLLALEAQDGSTVFVRADQLQQTLARLYPQQWVAGEPMDLGLLRDPEGMSRGVGDWVWRRLTELELRPDAIIDAAREQALQWLGDQLGDLIDDTLGTPLRDRALFAASTYGARALMQAIETRLAGEEGLYRWQGGMPGASALCRPGDARLSGWGDKPALLFIHGTGSCTVASFGDLAGNRHDWEALTRQFGDRIFGFEHRTFSKSPIDNALMLVAALPARARLALVTHSRGGLVGDLLCLGGFNGEANALIREYQRKPRPGAPAAQQADLARYTDEERAKLGQLVSLLAQKDLRIERYVRVACPAAGTALLSDNLDVFLSGLLNLVRKFGSWASAAAASALATPVAGEAARQVAESALKLLTRVVLEIADKRLEPQFVPGLEAMLTDAPMGALLARAPRRDGVRMAVIAGDIEGGGVLKRLGVMFTDWMFFDRADNDLVVDTVSMYAGLAAGNGAHALFEQGEEVSHFAYFRNTRSREALRDWLLHDDPERSGVWRALGAPAVPTRVARGAPAAPENDRRPVLVYLPGILGSSLEVDRSRPQEPGSGDCVWLDFVDLARGGLARLAIDRQAWPEDVVHLAYGKLAEHLEASHKVLRYPYDWRNSLHFAAAGLEQVLEAALREHPGRPVRILAHSMGGLVVRTLFARRPDLWEAVATRPGGRLLMLGTPNRGSHLLVSTLLGLSDTIRLLGRIDLKHDLNEVLQLLAAYPGALNLLPRPGFTDTGGDPPLDYYAQSSWQQLAAINHDRWFGDRLGGLPAQVALNDARIAWDLLPPDEPLPHLERIAYVFGQAEATPCGLALSRDAQGGLTGIKLLTTPAGDGSVTWASGRLDWLFDAERCWYMPVDHMGLTSTERHFDDIAELLETGHCPGLGRLPVSRAAQAAPLRAVSAAPPPGFVSAQQFTLRMLGGRPDSPAAAGGESGLSVAVCAMDLRFARQPVLCGHYIDDPIAAAERTVDIHLVDGALSQRRNLGVYAGEIGTASIVLMPRNAEELRCNTGRGAVVCGLGEYGKLSSEKLVETVCAGVLRLLLHTADRQLEACADDRQARDQAVALKLASLLIGYNSTTHISVDESVAAIVRGVCEANHQFRESVGRERACAQVAQLEFIELYLDAAITAARAVARLPQTLAKTCQRLRTRIHAAPELRHGDGVRPRLSLAAGSGYWPRLIVSNADVLEDECPPACYQPRVVSPMPAEMVQHLVDAYGCACTKPGDGGAAAGAVAPLRYAERLKFVFLSERARAESVVQQRQPGLVEALVAAESSSTTYQPALAIGRTLFQLLMPLDFKAAAREAHNLLLVVDGYTANLPWEMLQAGDEPLVLRTRMVRQLMSARYRLAPRTFRNRAAFVVANPNTRGYFSQFGGPDWQPLDSVGKPRADCLAPLAGAAAEGRAVCEVLQRNRYDVACVEGEGASASAVIGKLFLRPYRIIAIAAHGVFQVAGRDGKLRSGVVLSDGVMLTATEVGQMEAVPDLVYLSCCHLGKADVSAGAAPGRLAYSLARELIEMGVRCVVAAGWEVDDQAAHSFALTFFERFVEQGDPFGEAIHQARRATYDAHPMVNTWGAYQAYGDPSFRLEEVAGGDDDDDEPLVAPQELLDWLEARRLEARLYGGERQSPGLAPLQARIAALKHRCPPAWQERPDVQYALGQLYGEHGEAGFEAACAAYQRAIAADVRTGAVPLASIEQLANLEARSAERLGDADGLHDEALARIGRAIARLDGLRKIDIPHETSAPNAERSGLLGGAYKRRAVILARAGRPWDEIRPDLEQAHRAYQDGAGAAQSAHTRPFATLNALQLEALIGPPAAASARDEKLQLAERSAHFAREKFATNGDYFDAVTPADAELARQLLQHTPDGARIAQAYRDAMQQARGSARQRDSSIHHLRQLALLFRCRDEHDPWADALQHAADLLSPAAPRGGAAQRSAASAPVAGGD